MHPNSDPRPIPTSDALREIGASFATYRGCLAPQTYDDEPGALDPVTRFFDRSFCDLLVLRGDDRHRFLHGQTTCDIKDLSEGQGTYGFLTTIKGRVEAEMTVLDTGDTLWLDLPPGFADPVRARLEKYLLIERVEIEDGSVVPVSILGDAAETLRELTEAALPASAFEHAEIQVSAIDGPVRCVREPDLGDDPVWTLWIRPEAASTLYRTLRSAGASPLGWIGFERRRILAGRPLCGVDFGPGGPEAFPQETGLEDAVSYTKGCYLGQEVVARIHYRGGVQRRLCGLRFDALADGVVAPLPLEKDGKSVGRVTSISRGIARGIGPAGDEAVALGLGIVHQRAERGTRVRCLDEEGSTAGEAVVGGPPP